MYGKKPPVFVEVDLIVGKKIRFWRFLAKTHDAIEKSPNEEGTRSENVEQICFNS